MAISKIRLPQIKGELPDNSATAFKFEEGGQDYLTFDTQNGAERILVGKKLEVDGALQVDGAVSGSKFTTNLASSADADELAGAAAIKSYVDAVDITTTLQAKDDGNNNGAASSVSTAQTLAINSGEGLTATLSAQTFTIAAELATAAANAAGSNLGVSSFASADFAVSAGGFATIKAQGVSLPQIINATASARVLGRVSGGAGSFEEIEIDADMSSVSASDNTLASAKAIKSYVDTQITAQDLDFQADSGGALAIDLDSETLSIVGTSKEIETAGSGNQVQIGLPDDVKITNDLTIGGDLHVEGTRIIANSREIMFEDKSLAIGVPNGMQDASKVVTVSVSGADMVIRIPLGECTPVGANGTVISNSTLSGDFANGQRISYAAGAKVYVVDTTGHADAFKDQASGATIKAGGVVFSGAGDHVDITLVSSANLPAAATYQGGNVDKLSISKDVLSQNVLAGTGFQFPAQEASSLEYKSSESDDAMVHIGHDLFVDNNDMMVINAAGNSVAMGFRSNSNVSHTLKMRPQAKPTAATTVDIPLQSGTMCVNSLETSGAKLNATTGEMSIDIANASAVAALADSDMFLMADDSDGAKATGKITLLQLKGHISAGGTLKQVEKLGSNGGAGAIVLTAGTAYASSVAGISANYPTGFNTLAESRKELYLNGQLLLLGSGSGQADYFFDGAGSSNLKLDIDLYEDDNLQFITR